MRYKVVKAFADGNRIYLKQEIIDIDPGKAKRFAGLVEPVRQKKKKEVTDA